MLRFCEVLDHLICIRLEKPDSEVGRDCQARRWSSVRTDGPAVRPYQKGQEEKSDELSGYNLPARSPIAVAVIAMTALMSDSPATNPEASATL